MKKYIILIASIFNILVCYSQTIINGTVTDINQKKISDITITLLLIKDSSIVKYTNTDEKGYFKLSYDGNEPELLLTAHSFDTKKQIKRISNRTQTVNFTIETGSVQLKEVIVKSKKMWAKRDTINYSVAAFKDKRDVVLEDILKKLPGITVDEGGMVKYNGKSINKFYIENMDMLKDGYGIATKNIGVDDVSTVQVFEHHQPIKALEKLEFSQQAAINIKLKQGSKGVYIAYMQPGIGLDTALIRNEEVSLMRFAKKNQHLLVYKTNDNGTDYKAEFGNGEYDGKYTRMQQPSSPPFTSNRYLNNDVHYLNSNNIEKTDTNSYITYNVSGYMDKQKAKGLSETGIQLPDLSNNSIREDIRSIIHYYNLKGVIEWNNNAEKKYLKNQLNFQFQKNSGIGNIFTNQTINGISYREDILQNGNALSFSFTNYSSLIKNIKGKTFDINWSNSYSQNPEELVIIPGINPVFFNNGSNYDAIKQQVLTKSFNSALYFKLHDAVKFAGIDINPTVNIGYNNNSLTSDISLKKNNIFQDINSTYFTNNMMYEGISANVGTMFRYRKGNLRMELNLPVSFRYSKINNNILTKMFHKFYFNPLFHVFFQINSDFEGSMNYNYSKNNNDLSRIYTSYILNNYRSINHQNINLFESIIQSVSTTINYKDVVNMFFAGGNIGFSSIKSNYAGSGNYNGIFLTDTIIRSPIMQSSYMLSLNASKAFDWKKILITMDVSKSGNKSELFRNSIKIKAYSDFFSVNTNLSAAITNWLSATYNANWSKNSYSSDLYKEVTSYNQLGQSMKLDFLFDNIGITASVENYYNSSLPQKRDFSIADGSVYFFIKKMRFNVNFLNIFNTRKYIIQYNTPLNSYYTEYDLRPFTVMLTTRIKIK